jgi:hypothetical protein
LKEIVVSTEKIVKRAGAIAAAELGRSDTGKPQLEGE